MIGKPRAGNVRFLRVKGTDRQAIVDDEDFDRAAEFTWTLFRATSSKNLPYVFATIRQKSVLLHRFILGVPRKAGDIDHINLDTFDNRKANLRLATASQSGGNMRKRRYHGGKLTTSRFKGVIRLPN